MSRGRERPHVLAFRMSDSELENFNRALEARFKWNARKHRADFLRLIVKEHVQRAVGTQLSLTEPAGGVNRDRGKPETPAGKPAAAGKRSSAKRRGAK